MAVGKDEVSRRLTELQAVSDGVAGRGLWLGLTSEQRVGRGEGAQPVPGSQAATGFFLVLATFLSHLLELSALDALPAPGFAPL